MKGTGAMELMRRIRGHLSTGGEDRISGDIADAVRAVQLERALAHVPMIYAVAIFNDARTPEEMEHAIPYFKKAAERARRTQGEDHALTQKFEQTLADARGVIDGKGIARLSNINP